MEENNMWLVEHIQIFNVLYDDREYTVHLDSDGTISEVYDTNSEIDVSVRDDIYSELVKFVYDSLENEDYEHAL